MKIKLNELITKFQNTELNNIEIDVKRCTLCQKDKPIERIIVYYKFDQTFKLNFRVHFLCGSCKDL